MINLHVLTAALQSLGHNLVFLKVDLPGRATQDDCERDYEAVNFRAARHPLHKNPWWWQVDKTLKRQLESFVENQRLDGVIQYGADLLSLLGGRIAQASNWVILGDPPHLVQREALAMRVREHLDANKSPWRPWRWRIRQKISEYNWRWIYHRLKAFDGGYATAAHHADFFARENSNIFYQPSPVIGNEEFDIKASVSSKLGNMPRRMLMIGHNLSGTSNSYGMADLQKYTALFAGEQCFADRWRLVVAGGGLSDAHAQILRKMPFVEIVGKVDLANYAKNVSVLLNTIPHELGNRTRIAACFAHGIPAVTHSAAISGMPSLAEADGGALIYSNPSECLGHIRALDDDWGNMCLRLSVEAFKSYCGLYSKSSLEGFLRRRWGL